MISLTICSISSWSETWARPSDSKSWDGSPPVSNIFLSRDFAAGEEILPAAIMLINSAKFSGVLRQTAESQVRLPLVQNIHPVLYLLQARQLLFRQDYILSANAIF